jgi:IstB-like ATP binding protein
MMSKDRLASRRFAKACKIWAGPKDAMLGSTFASLEVPPSARGPIALVARLVKGHAQGRLEERLIDYIKPKLLIIDELGYLPLEPDAAHLFFQLVSRRYELGAILITSSRRRA